MANLGRFHAKRVLERILHAAERATEVQDDVLLQKISRNRDSRFGKDYHFSSITDYASFRKAVPVMQYESLSPYVERVMAGELDAMFGPGQRVLMFAMSSGTTDRPKYIPVTEHFLREYRAGWNAFGAKALTDHADAFLRPIVQISSRMDEEYSSAGIPCGAITGIMARTQKKIVQKYYVSRPCISLIEDAESRYYTVMRLALAGDVGWLIAANPATPLKLAQTMAKHCDVLVKDLRDGGISGKFDIPGAVFSVMRRRLRPNPARATQIEGVINRTGTLRPKHCWNISFLANWTGGTMGMRLKDLPEWYGNIPIRDVGLLASEGRMSIPLEDNTPVGVLDVLNNFFEFIPVDEYGSSDRIVLRSHELEVGKDYYILLTTSAGFYRYDIGDVVRVRGFLGEAPMIEFLNKGQHTSSLTGEKLTEKQVVLAYQRACLKVGIEPTLFVLAPQWDDPPYYRLHVENIEAASHIERAVEAALSEVNIEYGSKRTSGRLGPVKINPLPEHYLTNYDASLSERHRKANEQFKHRYLFPMPGDDKDFPLISDASSSFSS